VPWIADSQDVLRDQSDDIDHRHAVTQAGGSRADDDVQPWRSDLPVQVDHPAARSLMVLRRENPMALRGLREQPYVELNHPTLPFSAQFEFAVRDFLGCR
jgi:hypothetical protein